MKLRTLTLLGAMCLCHLVQSQDQTVNFIKDVFKKRSSAHLEEQLYIHTDRANYWNGETIWFKAYLTEGAYKLPSTRSNTLYVELISPNDSIHVRKMIQVKNGLAMGDILIEGASAGEYTLRAYTQWMRNFGSENFFYQKIPIDFKPKIEQSITKTEDIVIDFFPESGNLIQKLTNRIAFKAINQEGYGVKVKGIILDDLGAEITKFETTHNGMGIFQVFATEGRKYHARINGTNRTFPLPLSHFTGYTLRVNNLLFKDQVQVSVGTNFNTPDRNGLILVAHSGGVGYSIAQFDISSNTRDINIDRGLLPTGIVQISLLDKSGEPLAERLVFNHGKGLLNTNISTNKSQYGAREKVTVNIEVNDNEGNPISGSFSLSAFDEKWAFASKENIQTSLLLTNDLRGSIEQPDAYFTDNSQEKRKQLDLLMMVNGWRRFSIPEVISKAEPDLPFDAERGINLTGRMTTHNGKKVIGRGQVLFMNAKRVPPMTRLVDVSPDGQFKFEDLDYQNDRQAFIEGRTRSKDKWLNLELDPFQNQAPLESREKFTQNILDDQAFVTNTNSIEPIIDRESFLNSAVRILPGAEVFGEKERPVPLIYGEGDTSLDFDDDLPEAIRSTTKDIRDIMFGRVPGLFVQTVTTNSGQLMKRVVIRGVRSIQSSSDPLILLDNAPILYEGLGNISPIDIKRIEVFRSADKTAIFGTRGGNGVIAIYTRRGSDIKPPSQEEIDRGRIYLTNGYHAPRQFYAPKYEISNKKSNENKNDYRLLLHWEPMVTTDKDGKATLSFYTADQTDGIVIQLQGMTAEGQFGNAELRVKTEVN